MSGKLPHSAGYLRSMLQNKYFIKNISLIIGIIMLLFFVSSYLTNYNSRKILENELLSSDRNYVEIVNSSVDSVLSDMRMIAAALSIDSMANTFFSSSQPENMIAQFYPRLQEKLEGYINSYPCIHSIYLYSGITDTILTKDGRLPVSAFPDLNWMEEFAEEPEPYVLFSRSMGSVYPDFLCIMKQMKTGEKNAAIVINIILKDINILTKTQHKYSDVYLIDDASRVIYHADQHYLFEPLSINEKLEHFSPDTASASFISSSRGKNYTYTQLHSSLYPLSYVLITDLENYSQELLSRQTIFFTIFVGLFLIIAFLAMVMGLRFFQPIDMLTKLLTESSDLVQYTDYPSKEISDLAARIISYAQTNRQLADELSLSLQKLNKSQILALQAQINPHFLFNTLSIIHVKECQILGYHHELPDMTLKLSRILRYAISSTDMVTLESELEYIRQYIDLLKFRDMDAITITYDIDPALMSTLVPKLFIQPLIENVFLHAFPEDCRQDNRLNLSIRQKDNLCIVTLTDNGIGMNEATRTELLSSLNQDALSNSSIGIRNVICRMKLIYGEAFSFQIRSKEMEGTTLELVFPLQSFQVSS